MTDKQELLIISFMEGHIKIILSKQNAVKAKSRITINAIRLYILEKTVFKYYENWLEVLLAPPALRAFSPAKYSLWSSPMSEPDMF